MTPPLRRRVHVWMSHYDRGNRVARLIETLLIGLILLNVIAVMAETIPAISGRFQAWFDLFERVSVAIFATEYIARLWSCVEDTPALPPWRARLRYMISPLALVDLLAILPFFLAIFGGADLRVLRVLRVLRIFKLTRYANSMTLLTEVLREERRAFVAAFSIFAVLLVLAASGIYLAEYRAQPDVFGSIPASLWWAIVTLSTVGYGDAVPVTGMGKLFGGLVSLIGIGVAALPAGILASGMADMLHRRRDILSAQIRIALDDGIIDEAEDQALEELRIRLGISREVAHGIRAKVLYRHQRQVTCTCPECGHHFHHMTD